MSIILKGVEIPDGTDFAHITFTKKGNYLDDIEFFIDEIIQIPKGHGNIIDESKAVVTETIDGYYEITAPTILEAEEYDE